MQVCGLILVPEINRWNNTRQTVYEPHRTLQGHYIVTQNQEQEITFTGTDKTIRLSEWDTPDDAFAEYKIMKQADILLVAARYKESIPDYIYDRLLKVEVKPY